MLEESSDEELSAILESVHIKQNSNSNEFHRRGSREPKEEPSLRETPRRSRLPSWNKLNHIPRSDHRPGTLSKLMPMIQEQPKTLARRRSCHCSQCGKESKLDAKTHHIVVNIERPEFKKKFEDALKQELQKLDEQIVKGSRGDKIRDQINKKNEAYRKKRKGAMGALLTLGRLKVLRRRAETNSSEKVKLEEHVPELKMPLAQSPSRLSRQEELLSKRFSIFIETPINLEQQAASLLSQSPFAKGDFSGKRDSFSSACGESKPVRNLEKEHFSLFAQPAALSAFAGARNQASGQSNRARSDSRGREESCVEEKTESKQLDQPTLEISNPNKPSNQKERLSLKDLRFYLEKDEAIMMTQRNEMPMINSISTSSNIRLSQSQPRVRIRESSPPSTMRKTNLDIASRDSRRNNRMKPIESSEQLRMTMKNLPQLSLLKQEIQLTRFGLLKTERPMPSLNIAKVKEVEKLEDTQFGIKPLDRLRGSVTSRETMMRTSSRVILEPHDEREVPSIRTTSRSHQLSGQRARSQPHLSADKSPDEPRLKFPVNPRPLVKESGPQIVSSNNLAQTSRKSKMPADFLNNPSIRARGTKLIDFKENEIDSTFRTRSILSRKEMEAALNSARFKQKTNLFIV